MVSVRFLWDEAKSEVNCRLRGFDFEFATLIFEHPTLVVEDERKDYGERRFVAIGIADGVHLTVVHTDRVMGREVARRIISARRANRQERTRYDEAVAEDD